MFTDDTGTFLRIPGKRARLRVFANLLGAALLVLSVACSGEPIGPIEPDPDPEPEPDTGAVALPILGLGAVPERFTSELAVFGDWAYTGTWGGSATREFGNVLNVWDVSGAVPVLRDSIVVSGAQTLGDVHVSPADNLMAVATEYVPGSIILYDVSDPGVPRELSRFESESTLLGVHTAKLARVNGSLYVFASIASFSGGALVVVDVSDPAQPREVLNRVMGQPFIHDVFIRDGLLFTALWNEGVTLWDIGGAALGGSPADPVRIGNYAINEAHNVYWSGSAVSPISGRYVFVGQEIPVGPFGSASRGDIFVLDIADPAAPREVAFFSIPQAGTHNFSVDEAAGIMYVAYYNAGVRAIDIRGDLSLCDAEHKDSRGRCDLRAAGREVGIGLMDFGEAVYTWGVQWVNGDLYASDMLHGLFKLDARPLGD